MLSVLTLTYKRQHLLEEAIYSFLLQNDPTAEMVVINDCPEMWYLYDHPQVRMLNVSQRFSSLGKKLEWGAGHCRHPYVYRLDDDDLLAPDALRAVLSAIAKSPGFDIYRSREHYVWSNGVAGRGSSVNNGNVYATSYLQRVTMPDISFGEDHALTFTLGGTIHTMDATTMIYRWGTGAPHISGFGEIPTEQAMALMDVHSNYTTGPVRLTPHFAMNYWAMLPP